MDAIKEREAHPEFDQATKDLETITLTSLSTDMESLNLISLYEAFYEGLRFANNNITLDEAYELIDTYYEEGGEVEAFFMMILEEYASSMGLGAKFKEIIKQQQN